jgi:hypothetical protein
MFLQPTCSECIIYRVIPNRYFSVGIGRYFSLLPIPIPENISVGIFGIKTLAGAPQKIGGSPLFPKKGGPRPPFCTLRPPFEEKKEFPQNFSKNEFPRILKKVFPPKPTYNNTDRNTESPANRVGLVRTDASCISQMGYLAIFFCVFSSVLLASFEVLPLRGRK